ncbi:DUF2085 domain-containing protein [Anaerotignum sp.]|uniref:DUF2085 domain-containing protein n=1 Tax=Anaerotignum sp. TaxID=2039241 RepID=UPI002A90FB72|nr:DUF2085 domain-containing protein [Anaerotignum sp.]MCI7656497.1 DUF2085 domain-containing protein [Clostridia bacterium]MDY5416250.1 DUF2085 domain-containing protein [Anaerotignum sp.]
MLKWLERWLPRIFGCHCRADRSFFFHGKQFPICARCTGEMIGILAGIPVFFLMPAPPAWVLALFLLPLVADGCIQRLTAYESTNLRRLVTGILFGYGIMMLFLLSTAATLRMGYRVGSMWNG